MKIRQPARIAISMRETNAFEYYEVRDSLAEDWLTFFARCCRNTLPVLVPNHPEMAQRIMDSIGIDGVILSGGNDLGSAPRRDQTEIAIIEYAKTKNLPTLGVCRGAQLIAREFNGVLNRASGHAVTAHGVEFSSVALGLCQTYQLNSFHNTVVSNLNDTRFQVIGKAEDNSIEAFISDELKLAGIMWHPEREPELSLASRKIFEFLFGEEFFV